MYFARCSFPRIAYLAALILSVAVATTGMAQVIDRVGAVGGVSIDTDGVLNNARTDELGSLSKVRSQVLQKVPGDLNAPVAMRKVSLRRLEEALNECTANKKPLPDAIKYLAGLQHVRYVFVYPEQKDIVLVGPGEGWKVDAKGNVVGATTGRPVMLLDDLLVALRTAQAAANGGITCSIDPTPEGLDRIKQVPPSPARNSDEAQSIGNAHAKALGMQQIAVQGVPDTSHFARVLVAADYRMKRIAMNFDPSPVRGLSSYLQMVKPRTMLTPRFWLEPTYEAVLKDDQGLAFELRGAGVKAMTEEDHVAAGGKIQHSGTASPIAQRWADTMTEKYSELALAEPIFGQLQDCMELAVVGALVVKERLTEKAGYSMPTLMDDTTVKAAEFNAPKQVDSQASVLKKGRNWVISASGGVAINSWAIVQRAKPSGTVDAVRAKAAKEGDKWYWN
jgi:hypothetical protein